MDIILIQIVIDLKLNGDIAIQKDLKILLATAKIAICLGSFCIHIKLIINFS